MQNPQSRPRSILWAIVSLTVASCGLDRSSSQNSQTTSWTPSTLATEEPTSSDAPCLRGTEDCRGKLVFANGGKVEYHRTFPLLERNENITRAFVLIHSANRAADVHFTWLARTITQAGKADSTMAIVPKFKVALDARGRDDLFWTEWPWGPDSENVSKSPISTFTAVDEILAVLARKDLFPNLKAVIINGNSAGGQFTQRYAFAGQAHELLSQSGIEVAYLVGAPSSYLYVDAMRPVEETTPCPEFNNYGYGLDNPYPYLRGRPTETMKTGFASKEIRFFTGTEDTKPEWLDVTCSAMRQGSNRYDRFLKYADYTRDSTPEALHQFFSVEGKGHTLDVLLHPQAQELFWRE
jgi:hypothetical protein